MWPNWRRLGSILIKPYTFFAAPDVFISYARRDGASYAEAIAAFLADAKRKFSCHIDQWDTTPGVRVPASILRAARRCHAAVIVGTPAALASGAVQAEVTELTASKRTIVVIELPSSPISAAVWYPLIQGLAPVRETGDLTAVRAGKPSQEVFNRLENAFTFWRRNRRIQSAAWTGTVVLAVAAIASFIFSQQAARSRSIAEAIEKSIRAQDMSSRNPAKSRSAMRLAMESMAVAHTSWGESTLRGVLLLMPSHQSSHPTMPAKRYLAVPRSRPWPARIDGNGNVVTWSDVEREDDGEPVFKVRVTDARTGKPARPDFDVRGIVMNLRFFGATFVIETHGKSGVGLVWAAKNKAEVSSLPKTGRSLAISPDGGLAVVINDDLELWSLGEKPAALRLWRLPDISAAAFSVDSKSIYAIRNAELIVFSAEAASAEPKLLSTIGRRTGDSSKRLFATARYLAVQIDSKVRIWNIAEAKWVHEIESHMDSEIVLLSGDRLADWSNSRAVISDLSAEDGVGFISTQLNSDCGQDRGRQIQLLDFSASKDGSHAVMACGNGIVKVISATDATPVASAPFEDETPWAAGIDEVGKSFFAITNGSGRASVSEWTSSTRSSPQIGGGEVARLSRSISLSSGGTVAGVFHSPHGSKLITFNSKTDRMQQYPWGRGSFRDNSVTVGQSGKRLAYAADGQIEIANLGESELVSDGKCPVPGGVMAIGFAGDDDVLAASSSAAVTVCRRTQGRWQAERTVDAGSWTVSASPDPIKLSPFAVSSTGSIAYLERGSNGQEPGRTINVETSAGKRFAVEQPAQVTALAFAQDETLLIGDRSGTVRSLSIRSAKSTMRTLGQHDGRIVAIVTSKDSRILTIGSENIVRMWDLDFTEEMVGLSGVMEFPLVSAGISGMSYLGAAGVALEDDRLVTLNQTARGLFAHIWKVPTGADLLKEAQARLGAPIEARR